MAHVVDAAQVWDRQAPLAIKLFTWAGALLQFGLSLAAIAIIAAQLSYVTYPTHLGPVYFTCLLGTPYSVPSAYALCAYGYVAAGVTLFLSLLLVSLMCVSSLNCAFQYMGEFCIAIFGLSWCVAAGCVFTHYSQGADRLESFLEHGLPRAPWRHAVFAIFWAQFGIFLVLCVVYIGAGCCGARHPTLKKQPGPLHTPPNATQTTHQLQQQQELGQERGQAQCGGGLGGVSATARLMLSQAGPMAVSPATPGPALAPACDPPTTASTVAASGAARWGRVLQPG